MIQGFFSKTDQNSLDDMNDIFLPKEGVCYLICNLETKLWLSEFPLTTEYTDDVKKAMRFNIITHATGWLIARDILDTHEIVEMNF